MPIILCPHCGTANRVGSNFCNRCGADLRGEELRYAPDEARPTRVEQAARRAAERLNPPPEPPAQPPAESPAEPSAEPPASLPDPAEGAPLPAQEEGDASLPPTVPFFDLGLTSPSDPAASQPWLRPAWEDESAEPAEAAAPPPAPDADEAGPAPSQPGAPARLVAAVQGLLAPLSISAGAAERPQTPPPPRLELNADQAREMRRLLADEPVLAARPLPTPPLRPRSLRIPWLFWLVGLAAALPVFLLVGSPPSPAPVPLPGVQEAYAAVQALPPSALVVAYWAYDPATAGEMDLVVLPALHHLLDQRARLAAVSLLPGGPATARRLVARALRLPDELQATQPVATFLVQNDFWPGGAASLSLLRQAAGGGLASLDSSSAAPPILQRSPDLALLFASSAEDVQHWLEVVQPLYPTLPVVAFTSAAADPVVRPYRQSGQLAGLVTGYDGAAAYEELRSPGAATEAALALRRHAVAQGWSQAALLLILAAGSLAGLLTREMQR